MARIYLVRHGKAAQGFDGHPDPGLDALGERQAAVTAGELEPLGPLPIYSSPLARARETAEPLAALWSCGIAIEPRVAEIPSPTADLAARSAWLREAMSGTWSELGAELDAWRAALVDWLQSVEHDCVVFSHFIAINAAVGAARNDDRLVVFAPDNASITELDNRAGALSVTHLGRSAQTQVN